MWNYKRTAGTQLGWAGIPAVLFFFTFAGMVLPTGARAEEGNEDTAKLHAAIGIRGALEFQFLARQGRVYTVEGLTATGVWSVVYGPVHGAGTLVSDFIPDAGSYQSFRLESDAFLAAGQAPSTFDGHAYSLNYGSEVVGFKFGAGGEGRETRQDGSGGVFAYSYRKIRRDVGELEITFDDGDSESIKMHFSSGRIGSFECAAIRGGQRPRKCTGTFRAGADVDPQNATPPDTLEGARFVFRDRAMTSTIHFTTDFTGSLSRQGGDTEVISYTYDVSSWPEVWLTVAPAGSEDTHEYSMNFGARNSGTFLRRIFSNGVLKDTDRGKFSGKGVEDADDDGKGGGNTETECTALDSLEGRTLQARIGGKVTTVLLNGAGTGSIVIRRSNGRLALQPFTYEYSKESCSEGTLSITIPKGQVDELHVFELEFTSKSGGSCVRNVYEAGQLEESGEGEFTISDGDGDLAEGGNNNNGEDDNE